MTEALIFPLNVILEYSIDYSSVAEELSRRYGLEIPQGRVSPEEIVKSLEALPDGPEKKEAAGEAEDLMSEAESRQSGAVTAQAGAQAGLLAASAKGLRLGLLSDVGLSPTSTMLSHAKVSAEFSAVVARDSTEGPHSPGTRITDILDALRVSASDALLFCRTPEDVRLAHTLGMDSVVVPSRNHDIGAILAAGPSRMLMSLAEIQDMLSISAD